MDILDENPEIHLLESLLKQEKISELAEMLKEMPTIQVCEFLTNREEIEAIKYLALLDQENIGRILSDFPMENLLRIFRAYERKQFAKIFPYMFADVRADLYRELTVAEQEELVPFLNKIVRDDVIALSAYPPETAGGIMTTDFVTIDIEMNAAEALTELRTNPPSSTQMMYYLYVVNDSMKMQGILSLKDLILSSPQTPVSELLTEFFIFAEVLEDRESVANKIEKYDLVAIPILNMFQQIVGIVRHDDAIDVIQAEQTEDMEKFSGIMPASDDLTYLDTSVFAHFKRRVVWLVSLAAVGIISGIIIHRYQNILEGLLILAIYMPMMTSTGGNTGTQSATVIIRALSLGELNEIKWWKVLVKEGCISFLLALSVAGMTYLKIYFFTANENIPSNISIASISFMISIAIAVQVITATLFGALLPIAVKRFGGDPAVAAGPAISTVVDITGLLIYFTIAQFYIF
jgi:magnesium transporter